MEILLRRTPALLWKMALGLARQAKGFGRRDGGRMNYTQESGSVKVAVRLTLRVCTCWLILMRVCVRFFDRASGIHRLN
jgi:hypothetical protein